jgi:hypothetical protein
VRRPPKIWISKTISAKHQLCILSVLSSLLEILPEECRVVWVPGKNLAGEALSGTPTCKGKKLLSEKIEKQEQGKLPGAQR